MSTSVKLESPGMPPRDTRTDVGQSIAVIGAGISGLTAAYLLSRKHQVTVFEANDYLGGHTHTRQVELSRRPSGLRKTIN